MNVNPEQNANVSSFHRRELVIDAQSPQINTALVVTPRMKEEARRLSRLGKSPQAIQVAMSRLLLDEMRQDPSVMDAFRTAWEVAGVDIVNNSHLDDAPPATAFSEAVEMIAATHGLLDLLKPDFEMVTSGTDIRRLKAAGKRGIILNLENTTPLGDDLNRVGFFYNLGIRAVQLTYNLRNLVGDGCLEPADGGLSLFGREVVRLLNDARIIIDVSHCGAQTTADVLAKSSEPVAMSHVACDRVLPHARARSDDEIRRVAADGGFIGVLLVPAFLQPTNTGDLSAFARQIEHTIELAGIEQVGIGTDYGRCDVWPSDPAVRYAGQMGGALTEHSFSWSGWRAEHRLSETFEQRGYARWTDWPNLTTVLLRELGLSETEARGILGTNFLRFFERVVG